MTQGKHHDDYFNSMVIAYGLILLSYNGLMMTILFLVTCWALIMFCCYCLFAINPQEY